MAFRPVNATARIWQENGLRFILREKLDPAFSLLTFGRAQSPQRPAYRPNASARPPQRPMPPKRPEPAEPAPGRESPKPIFVKPDIPPFEAWPPVWKTIGQSAKPGKVVWVYPQLGCDLLHRETTDLSIRRDFFVRILSEKPRYPQGTYTFWPYSLPTDSCCASLETDMRLFWAGVYRLQAQAVLLLGAEAGETVAGSTKPYTQIILEHGISAMVLNDIADLRESNMLFSRMMGMVRALLMRLNISPGR